MTAVFIPTRSRTHNIEKVLPKWEDQDQTIDHVFLVTEPDERRMYKDFLSSTFGRRFSDFVSVISPRRSNIGIGATRHFIVDRADAEGFDKIIISDDDAYPVPDTDINILCDELDGRSLGYGACFSFYGLMLGNDVLKAGRYGGEGAPHLVPGGMGYIMFSLDVQLALEVGNYDKRLHTFWEDAELVRDGMKQLGLAWHVHTGAWATSIGKRFMPGGLSDFAGKNRSRGEKECHKIVYRKWGEKYISHPDKRAMCKWQRMLDDFVQGWREKAVWV
jgi:hypothetical protein